MEPHGDWKFTAKVCGGSKINGRCGERNQMTYRNALAFCEVGGARLCTPFEVKKQLTAGTGCFADQDMVWTSTKCGTFQNVALRGKDGSASSCHAIEETLSVRCCSDNELIQADDASSSTLDPIVNEGGEVTNDAARESFEIVEVSDGPIMRSCSGMEMHAAGTAL